MLTCNFHRDWKYLSIISSGHIFGLCKIFSCFVLSCGCEWGLPITILAMAGVIIILEIVTGHRMHSDQTRGGQVTWHVPGCGLILPRKCESVQVMTHSDAHSLSDALWYLGFSGTGPKCWWPNCYKSYNPLFLLQMVTKLLIYFFFGILSAGPGAQERGQKLDKTRGVRPVFVFRTSGDQT